MNARRTAACLLLGLACQGCSALATYGEDRLRDLSDIIDVRYGTGYGLGSQVEALWLEVGIGGSTESYYRQWFGRKSVEVTNGVFAHALIVGIDGDFWSREGSDILANSSTGTLDVLVVNLSVSSSFFSMSRTGDWFEEPAGDPPILDTFRIGATVFLPGVSGGLYLNFGEVLDFVCGVVGYDLMGDDGIPKFRLVPD